MRVFFRDEGINLAARLVLAGLYVSFGVSKLRDIDQTIRAVRAYQLLPETLVPAVGAALPLLEILLGALLLVGLLVRPTAAVVALLSLTFVIGITSAWARGLSIECGCFGNGGYTPNPVPVYVRELAINAVMLTAPCGCSSARPPGSPWTPSCGSPDPHRPTPTPRLVRLVRLAWRATPRRLLMNVKAPPARSEPRPPGCGPRTPAAKADAGSC